MSDDNTIHQPITPPNNITHATAVQWLLSNIPELLHWSLCWRITFHNIKSNTIELEVYPSAEYETIADINDLTYRTMRGQLLLIRTGLDKMKPKSRLMEDFQ